MKRWRERARRLKTELFTLYLAARHPETPWYAIRVVPSPVLTECRQRAQATAAVQRSTSWLLLLALWAALAAAGIAFHI